VLVSDTLVVATLPTMKDEIQVVKGVEGFRELRHVNGVRRRVWSNRDFGWTPRLILGRLFNLCCFQIANLDDIIQCIPLLAFLL
jgi:hypothetical protein